MSAVRRCDSASCLLRPKNSLSDDDLQRRARDAPSATVLTVDRLPAYCTDRLYLLSELDVNAHSIRFLSDLAGTQDGPALPPSVLLYLVWDPAAHPTPRAFAEGPLEDAVRRCLRANGDDAPPASSPGSPRDGNDAAEEGEEGRGAREPPTPQLTRIYVVVDRLPSADAHSAADRGTHSPDLSAGFEALAAGRPPTPDARQERRARHHGAEVNMAGRLARAVAASRFLRTRIDGLSVGVTSDDRAAPGLEACMDAVARGAQERRRAARRAPSWLRARCEEREGGAAGRESRARDRLTEKAPERSPIVFVALRLEDLHHESMDHHDHAHHHHEGEDSDDDDDTILQCRVSSEWNGKGEYRTFADRAMRDWRLAWCGDTGDGVGGGAGAGPRRPRVPRLAARGRDVAHEDGGAGEPLSTAMVAVFLAALAAYAWQAYGDPVLAWWGARGEG